MRTDDKHPIVILDVTSDEQTALIAGRAGDSDVDHYYHVPLADMIELEVSVPAAFDTPATYLRQMHYLASRGKGSPFYGAKLDRDFWSRWKGARYVAIFGMT